MNFVQQLACDDEVVFIILDGEGNGNWLPFVLSDKFLRQAGMGNAHIPPTAVYLGESPGRDGTN